MPHPSHTSITWSLIGQSKTDSLDDKISVIINVTDDCGAVNKIMMTTTKILKDDIILGKRNCSQSSKHYSQ